MIQTNQPESAFPSTFKSLSPEEGQTHRWGMTLRDYFAAKAMQTFLQTINGVVGCNRYEYLIAENAYEIADAMLRAREAS